MILPELHPVIAELLNTKFNADPKKSRDVPAFRSLTNDFIRIAAFSEAESMLVQEFELTAEGLPSFHLRVYNSGTAGERPVLVYFHGGNWIGGNLQNCDSLCSTLAEGSNYIVISVDYALAPEHHFPVPVYQGLAVLDWIKKNGLEYGIDHHKIVVGGDNAGGNIAAGLVHLLSQKRRYQLFGQLLVCPALHYRFDTPSYRAYEHGFFISREIMQWSWKVYLGNADDGFSEFASPLLTSSVAHVPPTLIYTAEYDPLRDEAEQYASRLTRQGIPVSLHRFKGVTHNFWLMNGILNIARRAHQDAIDFLLKLNEDVA